MATGRGAGARARLHAKPRALGAAGMEAMPDDLDRMR